MRFENPVSVKSLAENAGAEIIGDAEQWAHGINEIHKAKAGDITFVDIEKYYNKSLHSAATIIIINKRVECPIGKTLLLVDDLEAIAKLDFDALQNFRWLLLRGPSRRVWPIVTMNAGRYGQVLSWIPNFRTRIFGRIVDKRVAAALGADEASALDKLEAAIQFSLRESESWIRFWLPSC